MRPRRERRNRRGRRWIRWGRNPAGHRLCERVVVEELWVEDIARVDEHVRIGVADRLKPRSNHGVSIPGATAYW
jgi:hypothetical protein